MDVEIRAASESDLASVLQVYDEAAAWLQSIGITEQWAPSFSDNSDLVETCRGLIGEGKMFVARLQGEIVGSFMLEAFPHGESHDAVWPDRGEHAMNLYVLAVRRSVAGRGVALQMLDWAAEHARKAGKRELRLDFWAGNKRLGRYYAEAGFESRAHVESADQFEGKARTYFVSRFAKVIA